MQWPMFMRNLGLNKSLCEELKKQTNPDERFGGVRTQHGSISTSQVSTLIQLNYKSMIAEKEYMYSRLMTAYTSPLTCNTVHSCLAGVYIEHF